jgi:hypothetical protein
MKFNTKRLEQIAELLAEEATGKMGWAAGLSKQEEACLGK